VTSPDADGDVRAVLHFRIPSGEAEGYRALEVVRVDDDGQLVRLPSSANRDPLVVTAEAERLGTFALVDAGRSDAASSV
jgi:hypothetical protein